MDKYFLKAEQMMTTNKLEHPNITKGYGITPIYC